MKAIAPKHLEKGDKVALILPSSGTTDAKIKIAVENIKSVDLQPVVIHSYAPKYKYLSAPDQIRIKDLMTAFLDNEIKAIFAIRGGYGATRILPYINYEIIARNPKIFVGFSDITALHLAFYKKAKLVGFHGLVAKSNFTPYVKSQIKNLLFKPRKNFLLDCKTEGIEIVNHGEAQGVLTGGNLSLLVSLIGTGFLPSFKNKIVLIEEIFEPPYKIDRMLEHLLQATDLSFANGIIFGTFNRCDLETHNLKSDDSFDVKEIIYEKFSNLGIPVIYGTNFGHILNGCLFPIGVKAQFNTDPFTLKILEYPVV